MNSQITHENGIGTVVFPFKISVAPRLTEEKYEVLEYNSLTDLFAEFKDTCASTVKSTPRHLLCAHATGIYTNGKVSRNTCEYINWLLIDIDKGNHSANELDIPYQYILHESNSSTPDNKCWHILIPLASPIYAKHLWAINYESNCKKLYPKVKVNIDVNCKDVARRFYIPACHAIESFKCNFSAPLYQFDLTSVENSPILIKKSKVEAKDEETTDFVTGSRWYDVEQVLIQLETKKIDMLPERKDWIIVGRALAEISETRPSRGADAFVRLSRLHKEIAPSESARNKMTEDEWRSKFLNDILNTASGEVHLGTFFDYAKKVGCYKERPKPQKDNGILYLLRPIGSQTTFYLPYKNKKEDDIVKLYYQEESMACILKRLKKDIEKKEFELTYEDVTFVGTDEKTLQEKIKEKATSEIEVDFRETTKETGYLLAAPTLGCYAEKIVHGIEKQITLLFAKHCVLKAEPIYHQDIDDFITQLPYQKEWFEQYIYWIRNCNYALPMLYSYGESKTGKSLLADLFGTLFSGGIINSFFNNEQFCPSGGDSPIILMDEKIKCDATKLKEFIVSNRTEINQKNKGKIVIRGFHRLITTENAPEPNLPAIKETEDTGALHRRIQFAKFDVQHQKYILEIPAKVKQSWVAGGRFLQHCEWIIKKIGHLEPVDAVFAIEPYEIAAMQGGTALGKTDQLIRQEVIYKCRAQLEDKEAKIHTTELRKCFDKNNEILNMTDVVFAKRIRSIFHRKGRCVKIEEKDNLGLLVRIPMQTIIEVKDKIHDFENEKEALK